MAMIALGLVLGLTRLGFAGGLDWIENDYDKALAKAKESGKLVHVHWGADWCGWCHKLEDETLSADAVREFMNSTFVNLKIDKDKYGQLAEKFHVGGIPDTQFLTAEGRVVKRIVGYLPAEDFLAAVKTVPESWKKIQDLEASVAKDDKDGASRLELAKLLGDAGDAEAAAKQLHLVIEIDKDNAKGLAVEAWWLLGDAQLSSDEPDIAIAKEALGKVVALDPKNEKGRVDNAAVKLAEILLESNPKDAKAALEKVVADYPKSDGAGEAMFMIGAAMANTDSDFDGAAAMFKKLAAEMPDDPWAKRVPDVLKQLEMMKNKKDGGDDKEEGK
ncbi:MAG: DUF255 domain-containing protein [Planctomycetes bacterium]|nr:DUF255 domain-containing protein [Planctomycetota bacterium]